MKKLINKELIRFEEVLETLINYRNDDCPDYQCLLDMIKSVDMAKTELLLRLNERDELEKQLASAQRAVEAMNKIIEIYEGYWTHDVIGEVEDILDRYQKEAGK